MPVVTELGASCGALCARNAYNTEFTDRGARCATAACHRRACPTPRIGEKLIERKPFRA